MIKRQKINKNKTKKQAATTQQCIYFMLCTHHTCANIITAMHIYNKQSMNTHHTCSTLFMYHIT